MENVKGKSNALENFIQLKLYRKYLKSWSIIQLQSIHSSSAEIGNTTKSWNLYLKIMEFHGSDGNNAINSVPILASIKAMTNLISATNFFS